MKKTLSIGLGFALLAGSFISFSNASRDAYHSYLYLRARENRDVMRRVSTAPIRPYTGTIKRATDPRRVERGSNVRGESQSRNVIDSVRRRVNEYTQNPVLTSPLETRHASDRTYSAFQTALSRRGTVSFNRINDAVQAFETYENQAFSIQIPEGWFPSFTDSHFFSSRSSDFTIAIKKVEKACSSVSFTMCAITLSKNENYKNPAEKIVNTSTIERESYFADTVLNKDIQTRVATESFVGRFTDEEKFISRAFITGVDGSVYIIETRTNPRNASRFIGVTKKVFDSFRIYETPLTQ